MKIRIYILVCLLWSVAFSANAQIDKADVRKGNRDFRKENYREAEIDYRKALVKDSLSVAANYNLANTLYKEGDMDNALKALERIKDVVPETSGADYWFNLGDVALARQDWQGAVDAFKQSLLKRPEDLAAKENYIYAKKKLQDQQNQQNQQDNQEQQDNQDQNDQQNQDDQNDQKDQQGQNDQNQDNKNDDQKDQQDNQDQNQDQNRQNDQEKETPQQNQQPKITPQAAQQMLQAIQAKEKETQDKVNKQKAEALKARQKDKNW